MASKNNVEIFWFQSAGPIAVARGGEGCVAPGPACPTERMLSTLLRRWAGSVLLGCYPLGSSVRGRARCYAEGTTWKPHKHSSFRDAALCSRMLRIPSDGLKGRASVPLHCSVCRRLTEARDHW